MTVPIKLFTLHAQLQGGQLISGNLRLSVTNASNYKDNIRGYFVVQDLCPGFEIAKFISDGTSNSY